MVELFAAFSPSMKRHIVFDCDGTLIDTRSGKYNLFPGMKDILLALAVDSNLYVWTARDKLSTTRLLQEHGVYSLFSDFSTSDDAFLKPHVGGIIKLLGENEKSSTCVIGDTINDILGARHYGCRSVGATWNPAANGDSMKAAGADFIARTPAECLAWLNQNLAP
jgi:phosphoglycolate phosphatase